MESGEFLGSLKREVMGHPALVHPFLERFSGGDADREGVRVFAVQYYRHVRVSRLYLAALISNCKGDEALQLSLASVLMDEYGELDPGATHPALYRRFMEALGLTESEWEEPPTLPEIEAYIAVHEGLSRHPDVRLGLGALGPASEWPVPPIYARLANGLRRAADLDDRELEIFISHVTMDVEHARIMMDATEPYVRDAEGQSRVREGAMRSLDARSVMLDGLYRAVYRESVPLTRERVPASDRGPVSQR
ncbi:TenA family transcriptional regulator [Rubrobacter radiotolerans]|uniref:Iron-containing redox enzyme family protein n=1 Tax=Rubrobacter radiotolerans TaxID=42256 RepID=A0AB35T2T6_RUBRA|nr:iron-containing redox enzyme family protein [Rubrobacter radiotolerans]MDX5893090.1 iron-containing redox enzyme family protein [Rubrobacter radiotolerans]